MSARSLIVSCLATLVLALAPSLAKADHYDRRYPDYGNRLICESRDGRIAQCAADVRGGVRLVYQRSRSACIEGRSWGWNRRGVWVAHGCRGEFLVFGRVYGDDRRWDGDRYDRDWDDRDDDRYGGGYGGTVRCESHDGRYNACYIGRGFRGARLERELSRAYCREGYSWGTSRDGIWVDRGCRAEFRVY